jgi:uncharacterized protein (TIGR03905 family)
MKGAPLMTFTPSGVCAEKITFEIDNDIVKNVQFERGCPGNLMAISKLVEGMPVSEVVKRLKGIHCGNKTTSCADQLATALENMA